MPLLMLGLFPISHTFSMQHSSEHSEVSGCERIERRVEAGPLWDWSLQWLHEELRAFLVPLIALVGYSAHQKIQN